MQVEIERVSHLSKFKPMQEPRWRWRGPSLCSWRANDHWGRHRKQTLEAGSEASLKQQNWIWAAEDPGDPVSFFTSKTGLTHAISVYPSWVSDKLGGQGEFLQIQTNTFLPELFTSVQTDVLTHAQIWPHMGFPLGHRLPHNEGGKVNLPCTLSETYVHSWWVNVHSGVHTYCILLYL